MISTEIYIEDYKLDLLQDISTEFTYTIDDVADFGSKNTSYSKTISLSGTAKNNQIFGFVFDLGNGNLSDNDLPNVNYNYNASKAAQCRIFIDKVQIFKGTLRILEILIDKETIEYQCSVFGELGGLITLIGNKRLEDLNFDAYDHVYNLNNITKSWDETGDRGTTLTGTNPTFGSGYYYPLIDYGFTTTGQVVSANKVDFNLLAFRPALFVREYMDKIIKDTGYTYESDFFDTELFNRLIVPNNQIRLYKMATTLFRSLAKIKNYLMAEFIEFNISLLGDFTTDGLGTTFTYTGSPITANLTLSLTGIVGNINPAIDYVIINIYKNGVSIGARIVNVNYTPYPFTRIISVSGVNITSGDQFNVFIQGDYSNLSISGGYFNIDSSVPTQVPISLDDNVVIKDTIPKGIFQKDFFLSIAKMFNLYIYDDIFNDNKLYIKPYVDFYETTSATAVDWTNKIDRSKPLSIKPMSELNARYYHYKFKQDNDFYNENYRKKYNESYGDRIYDTTFDFSKDTDSLEVIFAPSVLFQGVGTDKIYPAIYKKSNNNTKEDAMDSVIRILQAQKRTATSWYIVKGDGSGNLSSALTTYGYAGHLHFDGSNIPDNDINFGAPKELQFNVSSYPSTNLFNAFYSSYMAEITNKDSKLLTCNALLNSLDIFNLDFSKYVWIDGVLFRLNKVEGFNPMEYNTTKINLLKVIETTY
jgi:hypothetical protein